MLDIDLDGIKSYPIADALSERRIPFVFASGYGAQGNDPRYSNTLALQKSFTMEDLAHLLSRVLNEAPLSDEYR